MDYDTIAEYLSQEMGVRPGQIKNSFSNTPALKGINPQDAYYEPVELDAGEHMQACGGRIPLKMYELHVSEGEKTKTIHTYSHTMEEGGLEKRMVTTSGRKPAMSHRWEI